ncbi:aminopeptidase P family protein [Candidatus Woesearchaeota archaeon]|nr:aminopeptidase P family protein [Candidatus Woesearchaeota archaeon]
MKKKGIASTLLLNLDEQVYPNLAYFCSYQGFGAMVIPLQGRPVLIVPKMEEARAQETGYRVEVYKTSFFDTVKKHLGKPGEHGKIGIDQSAVSLANYKLLKKRIPSRQFSDISSLCSQLRLTKTPNELSVMKKAFFIADSIVEECFLSLRSSPHLFRTEHDIALFLEKKTLDHGCSLSFPVIVGSGKASSVPHYEPLPKKIAKGFCVIDFGIRYKGYCTDMTRTIYFGKPSRKERDHYLLLQHAQQQTIAKVSEGRSCAELHLFCEKLLGKLKPYFIHSLGHGVGVQVHEAPSLSPKSKEKLREGMVFTIEPGIYFPNRYGIRIEDTLILQNNKPVMLTSLPKDLLTFCL